MLKEKEDLNKYEKLGVKEVWFFRKNQLEVYVYSSLACRYEKVNQSELLPGLDVKLVTKFMNKAWTGNLRLFKKEFVDNLISH